MKTAPVRPAPRPTYPWAQLYEIESQLIQGKPSGTRGRPSRPVPRHNTTLSLTEEESQLLTEITGTLSIHVTRASQGQIGGLALHLLERRLRGFNGGRLALPEDIATWESLAMLLKLGPSPQQIILPLPRRKKTLPLTDEERRLLRELTAAIGRRIRPMSQSQTGGLALRMLAQRLHAIGGTDMDLPEEVRDWESVVRLLDTD